MSASRKCSHDPPSSRPRAVPRCSAATSMGVRDDCRRDRSRLYRANSPHPDATPMTPHLRDRVLFRDADGVERAGVVNGVAFLAGEMFFDLWLQNQPPPLIA